MADTAQIDLHDYIAAVPDFPKPGIIFRDLCPLLQAPAAFQVAIEQMAERVRGAGAQRLVAIESRGFLFAAPLAQRLGLPLALARKPGKLPRAKRRASYALEYGEDSLELHEDAVLPGEAVVIIDDLLATGGTVGAACELIEGLGARVAMILVLIELDALGGAERLAPRPVQTLLHY